MGLPAIDAFAEALSEFHLDPPAPPEDLIVEDLVAKFEQHSQRVARLRQAFKRLQATDSELVPAIRRDADFAPELLESWIDFLAETERKESEYFREEIDRLESLALRTLKAGGLGSKRLKYAEILRAQVQVYKDLLNFFRDSRWRLIAVRAELEGKGDSPSPIFSDAESLALYLKQHK